MKRRAGLFILMLCFGGVASAQNGLDFSPTFNKFGLGPQDVSVKEKNVDAKGSFSFTVTEVPGQRLFVWLESTDTASNMLVKPFHNFTVVKDGVTASYLLFPVSGLWHVAVFFIPDGTSSILNLFNFSVNASASVDENRARSVYKDMTGIDPE